MSKNLSPSYLDSPQIIKKVYDEANDAIRVEIGSGTAFGINLSADSGDSISSVPSVAENKASITAASSGVIIAPSPCIGMKSFNLYTNTTSTLVGPQVCTLQVSPSDSDNVWISTSLTITPNTTSGTVVMGTINSAIVARRFQVIIAAPITSGSFDIYALGMSV